MKDLKTIVDKSQDHGLVYMNISRRNFLKGALAVGGALALSGCGETITETKTVTVTETNTNTVTEIKTVTVTESAPTVEPAGRDVMISPEPHVCFSPSQIVPRYQLCIGCRVCMVECAIFHTNNWDLMDSNIQVIAIQRKGGYLDIPMLCQHCSDSPCMAVCPPKVAALTKDEFTGAIIIDNNKCTACGLCIEACDKDRTGILHLSRDGMRVVGFCDFCGGNPSCSKYCPEDALPVQLLRGDGAWFASKPDVIADQVAKIVFDI